LPLLATPQEEKEALIRSLQKGNLEPVMVKQQGQRERMYIEATPQMQKVTMYNSNMEKVNLAGTKMQVVQDEKLDGKLPEMTKKVMEKVNGPGQEKNQQKRMP
jgi:hypothetical protein